MQQQRVTCTVLCERCFRRCDLCGSRLLSTAYIQGTASAHQSCYPRYCEHHLPVPPCACALQAVESRTYEHRWRERAEAAEAALEQARVDMADIRADMTRQSASLQVGRCTAGGCSGINLTFSRELVQCGSNTLLALKHGWAWGQKAGVPAVGMVGAA